MPPATAGNVSMPQVDGVSHSFVDVDGLSIHVFPPRGGPPTWHDRWHSSTPAGERAATRAERPGHPLRRAASRTARPGAVTSAPCIIGSERVEGQFVEPHQRTATDHKVRGGQPWCAESGSASAHAERFDPMVGRCNPCDRP